MFKTFVVYRDMGLFEADEAVARFLTKAPADAYCALKNGVLPSLTEATIPGSSYRVVEENVYVTLEQALVEEYDGKWSMLPVNNASTYAEFDKKAS